MPSQPAPAVPHASDLPEIRRIRVADLKWALGEGWRDMREKRGDLLFIGLLYPFICAVAAVATFNPPLLPLFFPLVAGLSIAGPAVASGFYEIARRREAGLDSSWRHFIDPLRGANGEAILMLALGLGVLWLAWLGVAWGLYQLTLGVEGPIPAADFLTRLFTTARGWGLIVLGNLAGLCFALATLALSVVSFPMAVDKPVDPGTALRTSLHAFASNPRVLLGWGLRVAILLALGCLPAAIGLAFVLPWLGYATWHLYTRLIVR